MPGPSPIFVFVAFGTLFDVHSAAREHAGVLGAEADRLSAIWRAKQLEYTCIHAGIDQPAPFSELPRFSLDYALAVCGLDQNLACRLLDSYRRLSPYPEVASALGQLKKMARGLRSFPTPIRKYSTVWSKAQG